MAVATVPTFAASGYLQFATALVPYSFQTFSGIQAGSVQAQPTARALPAGSTPASVIIQNLKGDACWVSIATAAATTTATQATVGANTIVVASATSIAIGQVAVAAGIPDGTLVQNISGTTITLSQGITAALSSTAVNFVTAVTPQTGITIESQINPIVLAYVSSGFVCALCINQQNASVLNIAVGV